MDSKFSEIRVLLAEDDPFIMSIYGDKLSSVGFNVEVAKTGKEVLEKLKEKKFDLLLLDIILPQINGFEVLKEIRKDKKLDDLKIIILSNLELEDEVKKRLELEVQKYLIKAYYTPTEIVEEIVKVLNI